jgi:hypothetical protein
MQQTLSVLLPLLQYVIDGGAGYLASLLFAWLRTRYARWKGTGDWLDRTLFSPYILVTRLVILVISILFAFPCAVLAAQIEGRDVLQAADVAVAALIGFTASQFKHAQSSPLAGASPARPSDPPLPVERDEVHV